MTEYIFIVVGALCILYFVFLTGYNKRISTTFAWYWLCFGVLQILIGLIVMQTADWLDSIICGICIGFELVFLVTELVICSSMLRRTRKDLNTLIILGAQVRGDRVTDSLKRRLDKALRYLQDHEQTICIVSGGQGRGENVSEAEAMAAYLVACGIEENRILLENMSESTHENLQNCLELLERPDEEVGIVTNNFHIFRSMRLAKRLGYQRVYPVVASCNALSFVNYMTREFFAVLYMMYSFREKGQ